MQAVIKDLLARGYDVFSEVGNSARFDLVVSVGSSLKRVQVKSTYSRSGVATLTVKTNGKTKSLHYTAGEVDIFALYVINLDRVVYVSSKNACASSCEFSVRFDPPKNGQKANLHMADHLTFQGALA